MELEQLLMVSIVVRNVTLRVVCKVNLVVVVVVVCPTKFPHVAGGNQCLNIINNIMETTCNRIWEWDKE